jgi:uncharacterized protein YndB with AHSA1/START domain
MRKRWKVVIGVASSLLVLVGAMAVVGSLRTTHVITVSRTTTASPEAIWALWADVPARTRWDEGLDHMTIDGPFEPSARGRVQVEGQGPRAYEVIDVERGRAYTDRVFLPVGSHTDWRHTITENGEGTRTVTFRVDASGPLSLASAVVLEQVLGEELPSTVDRLVDLAEAAPPS